MALYREYYGCAQKPFNVAPDPHFLFLTPSHREALAQLLYTVEHHNGIAVLTGEVGTGKTLLLRAFLERATQPLRVAYMPGPPRTVPALFSKIATEFGAIIGSTAPADDLNRFLLETCDRGETAVLVLDEAQQLSHELLEEVRLLSNLQAGSEKLLQVVFAAQPEFDAMLAQPQLRALRQRVVLCCSLKPLSADETLAYIGARLRLAGAARSPFTYEACAAVFRYSHGIPRLINILCDNAMLTAYALQKPTIGRELVIGAAADLRLDNDTRDTAYPRWRELLEILIRRPLRYRLVLPTAIGIAVFVLGGSVRGAVRDLNSASGRICRAIVNLAQGVTGRGELRESDRPAQAAETSHRNAQTPDAEDLYDE